MFDSKNINDINIIWFQQESAIFYTERLIIDLSQDQFADNFISRSGPLNWLPRKCDLTLITMIYADEAATLDKHWKPIFKPLLMPYCQIFCKMYSNIGVIEWTM